MFLPWSSLAVVGAAMRASACLGLEAAVGECCSAAGLQEVVCCCRVVMCCCREVVAAEAEHRYWEPSRAMSRQSHHVLRGYLTCPVRGPTRAYRSVSDPKPKPQTQRPLLTR